METINYQGQRIQVEQVNGTAGHMRVATFKGYWLDHFGDEELFRDASGQYYLRRKLTLLDVDGDNQRQASGRTFLHRISLRAAILWAIMRANPESTGLRTDALAALKTPASTNEVREFADGSMAVTVHLPPAPARFFREACELDKRDAVSMVYAAVDMEVRSSLEAHGRDADDEANRAFTFNAPAHPPIDQEHEPQYQRPPAPILLQLDSEACKLVRRYLEVSPWSYTSLDIVSGCVAYMLTLAFNNQEEAERMAGLDSADFHDGEWGTVERALYDALQRRTGGKSPHIKGAPGEPVGEDIVGVLIPAGLDAEAIELVRRFQEVSPRKYPLADIISGCVQYAMGTAFESHERGDDRPRNGRRFADSGWGYVETDIANVRQRREGKPPFKGDEPEEGYRITTGRRHAGNPADVALLAAAEPESIEDLPPDESEDDEDDNAGEEWKEGK